MAVSKSVQLHLVDGTAGGLIIAEIMNWTGKIMACPRSQLSSLLNREETRGTGVYILLGESDNDPSRPVAYIGETDEVRKRLIQHNQASDYWNRVITITNKDLNMTKAHVRFLESRLISKAKIAQRADLQNGNSAVLSPLPESAQSDIEQFQEQVELILPLLNVNIFRSLSTQLVASVESKQGSSPIESPEFVLQSSSFTARAREVDGEFVVLEGSEASPIWRLQNSSSPPFRTKLIENRTLVPNDDGSKLIFSRNHAFASPSGSATVVLGRNANGRLEWKVGDSGQRYKDWQESIAATSDKDQYSKTTETKR